MKEAELRVMDIARAQCGTFSRAQVLAAGVEETALRRRLRGGEWVRELPGVYRLRWFPDHPDRALWTAYLAVGEQAVVSHECAAARGHRLRAVPQQIVTLTAGRGTHHRIPGATVHQLLDVLPHHIVVIDGLRFTTVPRTIVDCAVTVSQVRVNSLVEQAINEKKTTVAEIDRVIREIERPNKPGIKKAGRALAKFGPGEPIGDTELERLLLAAVLGAGNPMPIPQFAHPGRHPGRGRVDFAYPDEKVILEADGRTWHQRIADLRRDRYRDNEAARAGWLTMRFMWEELTDDPVDVGAAVREACLQRRAA